MKYPIVLFLMICSMNCFSQTLNPQLFQTWYLSSVQNNDLAPSYNILAVNPPISPYLTINSDLTFTGQGACNGFAGNFTADSDFMQPGSFYPTLLVCSPQVHNDVEGSYFYFLQNPRQYIITPIAGGLRMIFNTALFGLAVFQNFQLSANNYDLDQITLYPNPANSSIFIDSKQLTVSKIQVINSCGQNVKNIIDNFEIIDVADLPSGVYIMKITTESGTVNKRIIKT